MGRDEVFRATGPTSSTSIDVKMGAKKDGTITAAVAEMRYQGGAFPGNWAMLACMTAFACYDIKNNKSIGLGCESFNRPKGGRLPRALSAYGSICCGKHHRCVGERNWCQPNRYAPEERGS